MLCYRISDHIPYDAVQRRQHVVGGVRLFGHILRQFARRNVGDDVPDVSVQRRKEFVLISALHVPTVTPLLRRGLLLAGRWDLRSGSTSLLGH
jgi:hypothetical protein